MGKSRQKLFLSAFVSGIALIMGLPGLADVISLTWEATKALLEKGLPAELLSLLIQPCRLFCYNLPQL
jgi:hypothetical protein